MSKKLLIGLAPLAAIVALAMIPMGAQAAGPHYTVNGGKTKEGTKTKTLSWGKLKNVSAAGEIICENVALANIQNPVGGGPGFNETLRFTTAECTLTGCPAIGFAKPVNNSLPWTGELIEEEGKIRQDNGLGGKAVKVNIGCESGEAESEVLAQVEFFTDAENHQKPLAKNGSGGCNKPGELEFDAGSGSLNSAAGKGVTSGNLKTCGYLKQDGIGTTKE